MSSWDYQVTRKESGRFEDRGSYLQDRAGSMPNPQLCQAMEKVVGGLDIRDRRRKEREKEREEAQASGTDPVADIDVNWEGMPWLTPVLGSGCLELPDDAELTPEALAEKVRHRLAEALGEQDEAVEGGDPFSEQAARFAYELARNRIHRHPDDPDPEESPQRTTRLANSPPSAEDGRSAGVGKKVETVAARVVLIATLLTQFYYRVKGASGSPVSRFDDDEATLLELCDRPLSLGDVVEGVVDPSLAQIAAVRHALRANTSLVDKGLAAPVCTLLQDVSAGLDHSQRRTLKLAHMRTVTETAWYLLTQRSSVYPGWTDLLLGLMLRDDQTRTQRSPRTRPRFLNLHDVPEKVKDLYEWPTRGSWKTAVGVQASAVTPGEETSTPCEPVTGRDRLYGRVADVLWAQARALRATNIDPAPTGAPVTGALPPTNTPLPPASAFVTSFDIELDMALWLRAIEAEAPGDGSRLTGAGKNEGPTLAPFYVVVPVHVRSRDNDEGAALCWLRGRVRPDSTLSLDKQLERIRRPEDWTLFTPALDARQLLGGPHVVHLSGCPLFELPSGEDAAVGRLIKDLRNVQVVVDEGTSVCVEHAVTVDEYLAFRQAEAELFWSVHKPKNPEDRRSRGLHPFLLASSPSSGDLGRNPRFWMAFGVPVADAAIRHRMVSQFTLRHLLALANDASGAIGNRAPTGGGGGRLGEPSSIPEPTQVGDRRHLDGVVVNRRINDDEASILYWIGLDVVSDDARNFIRDLEHYAWHLAPTSPRRPSRTRECR